MKDTNYIYDICSHIKNHNIIHVWHNCFAISFISKIGISTLRKLKWIDHQPLINDINAI